MAYSHAWFRRERLMIAARNLRRRGTPDRRGHGLGEGHEGWSAARPLIEKQMVQAMLADSVTELVGGPADDLRDCRGARPRR